MTNSNATEGQGPRYDFAAATVAFARTLVSEPSHWTNAGCALLTVEHTLRFEAVESGAWQPTPAGLGDRIGACVRVPILADDCLVLDAAWLLPEPATVQHETVVAVSGRVRLLVAPGRTRCARIVGTLSTLAVPFAAGEGGAGGGVYAGTAAHDWMIEEWDPNERARMSVLRRVDSVCRGGRPARAWRA